MSENIAFCFDNFFNPETGGDCLVGTAPDLDSTEFWINEPNVEIQKLIYDNVATIQNRMECYVLFIMELNGKNYGLVPVNFGTQTTLIVEILAFGSVVFEAQVGGITIDILAVLFDPNNRQYQRFFDISGCRHAGGLYEYGAVLSSDLKTCSILTCSDTAALQISGCGPLERCEGNGICMLNSTCTVTGPTVIDFHGQVNTVEDRCSYSLVLTPSVPDFHVLGNFQERRRKDVTFLDSVTLVLDRPSIKIHLEQGGRVRLDNTILTLNSSPQLVHNVELSKDRTGVTAKLSLSYSTISVFFDGYTAQIHLEGPAGSSFEGLCGNSSRSLSDLRLSEYSSTSCEVKYNDPADSTINCNKMIERCNLLKEAPFSSCNSDIDPEPYITACTNTLCKYPAVDGLNCQFLKAYARACRLQGNHTLDGWRSMTGCSSEAFCQDRTCSDHEFCGQKTVSGDTRCFCRTIFASKYRSTNTLGDQTVCSQNSASLSLASCLLEDKGIAYSDLHLNDQTCRGQMDELTHMVTFSFNSSNSCGTMIITNNSHIIYKNTITNQKSSSDVITRQDQIYIDFSCVYIQPDIETANFRIRDSSVIQHATPSAWNYTLTMKAYTDVGRTQAVESFAEVPLNQRIWVELKANGLDGDMVAMVTDSCWTTDVASSSGSVRHDLIIDGCANPADQTVDVKENGLGAYNYFSFNMFQFTGSSGEIYLHCKIHLCPKRRNKCTSTCKGAARRRRPASSKYKRAASAFISLAWTN
ncbi:alpha-tectorin-like [Oreochromis aureus]|uniref:ZP domain-containing protein n=1 Tax=Oreochromis aureus TaxID=47969 RepID=A0A668S246_OREAU|nr:alpha-tectorin-like [Oreochromis aureus]